MHAHEAMIPVSNRKLHHQKFPLELFESEALISNS